MKTFGILLGLLVGITAHAQTISIGDGAGFPGSTVTFPVDVAGADQVTDLNVRLQYDPAIFSSPRVSRGEALSERGSAAANSPEAGRLDVVVYGPGETYSGRPARTVRKGGNAKGSSIPELSALTGPDGTVFYVTLSVAPAAQTGQTYPITFVQGSSFFPASGMSDYQGRSLTHTTSEGLITISAGGTPTPTPTGVIGATPTSTPIPPGVNPIFQAALDWAKIPGPRLEPPGLLNLLSVLRSQ